MNNSTTNLAGCIQQEGEYTHGLYQLENVHFYHSQAAFIDNLPTDPFARSMAFDQVQVPEVMTSALADPTEARANMQATDQQY